MRKEIAFVVCSNGYGHFRRCIRVAEWLSKNTDIHKVHFFCTYKQWNNFQYWPVLQNLFKASSLLFHPINKNVDWSLIEDGKYKNLTSWTREIPKEILAKVDLVISDNLSGTLELRGDAILMGSFLWSEVLNKKAALNPAISKFIEFEVSLLNRYRPSMICQKEMAMPLVRSLTTPIFTSWMVENADAKQRLIGNEIQQILISGGGTGRIDKLLFQFVPLLLDNFEGIIYLSPSIYKKIKLPSQRVKLFSFEEASFRTIDLMICRPGVGSITDAVAFGIPMLVVDEPDDPEITFNSQCVKNIGFGWVAEKNVSSILNKCIQLLNTQYEFHESQKKLKEAPKDGIAEAGQFLKDILNLKMVAMPNYIH